MSLSNSYLFCAQDDQNADDVDQDEHLKSTKARQVSTSFLIYLFNLQVGEVLAEAVAARQEEAAGR